ncbi:MAG: YdeI/OmpD-associated family protein [Nocardioides sp.]
MRFASVVELGGKTATGIPVPDEVIESLAAGNRPPVAITINGHTYRTTAARMGGRFFVPLSAENRTAAGVSAGEAVTVDIENDTAPREVSLPDDLAAAMDDQARTTYDALAFTRRKEWVRWVEEAKRPETRATRIEKTVAALREGRKTR